MNRMMDIIILLEVVIRIGVVCRIVFCLLKIILNNDEGSVPEYKQKIKNALVFLVISECIWIIKNMIFSYYDFNI